MKTDKIQDISKLILNKIGDLHEKTPHLLVAIEGRCAAGKTMLAADLHKFCACNIIHMDHFFLRPGQRTKRRLNQPGGNVDYERFLKEVLIPLKQGERFSYHPYDCRSQELKEAVWVEPNYISIIEGSYSCHPELYAYYDLKVFLDVDENEQLRRIRHRNGELGAVLFQEKWIPLEERYFSIYRIKDNCDLYFQT